MANEAALGQSELVSGRLFCAVLTWSVSAILYYSFEVLVISISSNYSDPARFVHFSAVGAP